MKKRKRSATRKAVAKEPEAKKVPDCSRSVQAKINQKSISVQTK